MLWRIEGIVSKGDYNYAIVRDHPYRTDNDYVLHHRIVMENVLGRLLSEDEIVHHKNHNKKDNRRKNLKVMTRGKHSRLHGLEQGRKWAKLRCPECKSVFRREARNTHLYKPSKYKCTCCSPRCRGKFYSSIQNKGLTRTAKQAIKNNVIRRYRKYTSSP